MLISYSMISRYDVDEIIVGTSQSNILRFAAGEVLSATSRPLPGPEDQPAMPSQPVQESTPLEDPHEGSEETEEDEGSDSEREEETSPAVTREESLQGGSLQGGVGEGPLGGGPILVEESGLRASGSGGEVLEGGGQRGAVARDSGSVGSNGDPSASGSDEGPLPQERLAREEGSGEGGKARTEGAQRGGGGAELPSEGGSVARVNLLGEKEDDLLPRLVLREGTGGELGGVFGRGILRSGEPEESQGFALDWDSAVFRKDSQAVGLKTGVKF